MKFQKISILFLILLTGFTFLLAQKQKGKATYYSKKATGTRTASGERLHHDSMTCAHRTYPFGTLLKVTNPSNKQEVIVKVTDRGPFTRGRIIDLSWRAAKELGILADGVAMVTVERIESADIIKVPYRSKERRELPELDFGVSTEGGRFIDAWADQQKQNAHQTKAQLTKFKKDNALENKKKTPTPKDKKPKKK
ncbi:MULTISPECIES: septal ring lytic transglycosylase RlpA family protein [Prevotellaceae]|uniref:septal ring lytic transglycosylase RlpA family protein n=1 Tax=Prevotellaceae TaxID=171552 RepID=UPI0003B90C59|nr:MULTISPECIES: septal ring lytic transglycosylase RlpA family protein [Prevotellaceae]ERT58601.1 lipoprotein A-like protein [Prevotella sp. BV3P1]KGF41951.1 lipoprotein [Hoylesella buccalis DNF00985]